MLSKVFGAASAVLLAVSAPATAAGTMLSSWYGPYFHGRLTANGEVYDQWGYTAAHKTLPFGTRLRVCYQGCINVQLTTVVRLLGLGSLTSVAVLLKLLD